jgi:hypothetical protein
MRIEDIKVGMKVMPIKKSAGVKFDNIDEYLEWEEPYAPELVEYFNKNGFLYVNRVDKDSPFVWLWSDLGGGGDIFLPSDLIPYEEPNPHNLLIQAIKTFYQTTSVLKSLQQANPLMNNEQLTENTDWIVDAIINQIISIMDYPKTDFVFITIFDAIRNDGSFGADVREKIEGDI